MRRHVLIIDNNHLQPCKHCMAFRPRRFTRATIVRPTDEALPTNLDKYSHVILTGGSPSSSMDDSVTYQRIQKLVRQAYRASIPMLGICLGHELIITSLLSLKDFKRHDQEEIGWVEIQRHGPSRLFEGLPARFVSFANHSGHIKRLPHGFRVIGSSKRCAIEAYEHETKPVFGVQFHPEKTPRQTLRTVWRRAKQDLPGSFFIHPYSARRLYRARVKYTLFRNFYAQKRP